MKKLILIALLAVSPVWAQTDVSLASEAPTEKVFEEEKIRPQITVPQFIEAGKRALFDGSETKRIAPSYGQPVFSWRFGDSARDMKWGEKVAHSFNTPGLYTIELNVRQGRKREQVTRDIIVYDRRAILVSDFDQELNTEEAVAQAGEYGIWLLHLVYDKAETGFSAEETFTRQVQENIEFVKEADMILFHTRSVTPLQSFAQLWKRLSPENQFDPKDKLWVQFFDLSLDRGVKLVQPLFSILKPSYILLTKPEARVHVFEKSHSGDLVEKLKARAIAYQIIDERSSTSPFLVFSNLTTYFVSHGISQNVIYLLLAVPFIAFVIAFLRQFVGVSTFGVYAPLMLALSFMVLGLKFGFVVFLVVMSVSYLIRLVFEKVELLYIPKVSLLLSMLALSFFLVLGIAIYVDSSINLTLTIFPMLVMATVSEKFLSAQSAAGMRSALFAAGETVFVALLGYFLVRWGWLENAILALPEIILLPILGNIWLGQFTGLRLSEYVKFRTLFQEESHE